MDAERYSRQVLFQEIGVAGQARLQHALAVVAGCGALGSHVASLLVRAGVGGVRIVDRDVLELSNLQRQVLFDEEDVARRLPKAAAAAVHLRRINSTVTVEPHVVDLHAGNVEELVHGASVVVDATDNFETRYLLNDACVKHGIPWVYGGVVAAEGLVMPVLPGTGPCLRCLFPEAPEPGSLPTCHTLGIVNTAAAVVAALEATQALRILVGSTEGIGAVTSVDVWTGAFRRLAIRRQPQCPCCGLRRFTWLEGRADVSVTRLGARPAVQFAAGSVALPECERRRERTAEHGAAADNGYVVTAEREGCEICVFEDGRAVVIGTEDVAKARAILEEWGRNGGPGRRAAL